MEKSGNGGEEEGEGGEEAKARSLLGERAFRLERKKGGRELTGFAFPLQLWYSSLLPPPCSVMLRLFSFRFLCGVRVSKYRESRGEGEEVSIRKCVSQSLEGE